MLFTLVAEVKLFDTSDPGDGQDDSSNFRFPENVLELLYMDEVALNEVQELDMLSLRCREVAAGLGGKMKEEFSRPSWSAILSRLSLNVMSIIELEGEEERLLFLTSRLLLMRLTVL